MSSLHDRTQVKKVVIHHLGDGLPGAKSADELRHRANPSKYQFPAYDFGVLEDGTVVALRPLNYIGAHCVATKTKYQYGDNWWNKNSIGVVMAIDNTKYQPSEAMVKGLIYCLTNLCQNQGMTIDDLYPHYQVTATACPGGSYAKLGIDTGYFDYDLVEKAVYRNLNPIAPPAPATPPPPPVQPEPVVIVQPPVITPAPIVEPPAKPQEGGNTVEKKWYASKTIWANLLMLVAIMLQQYSGKEILTPEVQASVLVVVNLVLRVVTREEIKW